MELWKRRGTTTSLSHVERRERELAARVERGIDDGTRCGGLIEEIIAECRARIVTQAGDPSWRFLLGRCLMAVGDPAAAREALEAAAVLAPRDPRISAHLALWYQAAFLAASGARANLELPAGAGPDLAIDVRAFADLGDFLAPPALAARVTQLIDATLRFALRGSDGRMLKRHRQAVTAAPIGVASATPLRLAPLSRAG